MPWTCAMCSYAENNVARSRCEICDAAKPAQPPAAAVAAAGSKPVPSGPQWGCSGCTYVNAGRDAKCTMCGKDRPASHAAARAAPPAQPIAGAGIAPAAAKPKPSVASTPGPAPARPAAAAAGAGAARPAPTPSPPAAASVPKPAAAAAAASGPSEADIAFLSSMGFPRAKCVTALSAGRNREAAIQWLVTEGASPSPAPVANKPAVTPAAAAAKPAAAAPAASAAAKPAAVGAAKPAGPVAVVPALPKRTPAEQKALEAREAKRLELLRILDEEEKEKIAKAKAKAEAAAAPKKTASTVSAPGAASSSSAASASSVSASAVPAASPSPAAPTLSADQQKLLRIQEARAAEQAKQAFAVLRTQKRLEAESRLKSLSAVLSALKSNYDPLRFEGIITMLRKILDKIVSDQGATDKYRRIDLSAPKLELVLLRPIGPIWILKSVGFEEQIAVPASNGAAKKTDSSAMSDGPDLVSAAAADEPTPEQRVLYLPSKKVNLKALQSLSATLGHQLVAQSSPLPGLIESMIQSKRYPMESVFTFLLELRNIVHNIVVSTDEVDEMRHVEHDVSGGADAMSDAPAASSSSSASAPSARRGKDSINKNFRSIDKTENAYLARIKPMFPDARAVLDALGFELDPHDVTRKFLVVPLSQLDESVGGVKRYQIMLREIHGILKQVAPLTPIAQGIATLCKDNRKKAMEKFMPLFLEALRRIIADPHEQKLHRIALSKLQAKLGAGALNPQSMHIKGMDTFVQLFGFKPIAADGAASPKSAAGSSMVDDDESKSSNGSSSSSARSSSSGVVALEYPGFDVELLAIRADELERNWEALLEQAAQESGESSWSF